MTYKNKYGLAEIIKETPFVNIKEVNFQSVPNDCIVSIGDLEKISLIIDGNANGDLQISLNPSNLKQGYIILHKKENKSLVCVCKVNRLDFSSDVTPSKEIKLKVKSQRVII